MAWTGFASTEPRNWSKHLVYQNLLNDILNIHSCTQLHHFACRWSSCAARTFCSHSASHNCCMQIQLYHTMTIQSRYIINSCHLKAFYFLRYLEILASKISQCWHTWHLSTAHGLGSFMVYHAGCDFGSCEVSVAKPVAKSRASGGPTWGFLSSESNAAILGGFQWFLFCEGSWSLEADCVEYSCA